MKSVIAFDIETIAVPATQSELEEIRKGLKLGNVKDPEKVAAAIKEKEAKALSDNKFRIGGAKPISIAMVEVSRNDPLRLEQIEGLCSDTPEELARFFTEFINSYGTNYVLTGFNIRGFDLPIMSHLLFSTGYRLKHPVGKWDVVDLCENPLGREYKLKDAARRFGIEAPIKIDGSAIQELWDSNDRDAILEYNKSDVFITGRLFQALSTIYSL